jgi:hypothetical protein
MEPARFLANSSDKFQSQKSLVLMCRELFTQFDLSSHDRQKVLEFLQMGDVKATETLLQSNAEADKITTLIGRSTEAIGWLTRRAVTGPVGAAREATQRINDAVYVGNLHDIVKYEPLMAEHAESSVQHLCTYLAEQVRKIAIKLSARVEFLQQTRIDQHSSMEFKNQVTESRTRFRIQLLEELNAVHVYDNASDRPLIFIVDSCSFAYHRI